MKFEIGHSGTGKNPKKWKFQVRWLGYELEDNTMLNWAAVKDLAALNKYSKENPHLKLEDELMFLGVKFGRIIEKNTCFHGADRQVSDTI